MTFSRLIELTMASFANPRWSEHSLKVFAYSLGIGEGEGVDGDELTILGAAALLHDIGIPAALRLHGDAAGPHQEAEGAKLSPALLERAGVPEALRGRIVWLVGHHHREQLAPSDTLLQMLMEADYLVNLAEGNVKGKTPESVLADFFRTATGKRYMRALFGL